MAKANLVLPDGAKVNIVGSAEEVALLLAKISQSPQGKARKRGKGRNQSISRSASKAKSVSRKGPQALIAELAQEGYFKSKRNMGEIQKKLEERGHIYALTSLSAPLLRLVQTKVLRRIKEKHNWVYVS